MSIQFDKLLDSVQWTPTNLTPEDGAPYATHTGQITVDGVELCVYLLSDGARVIDAEDLSDLLGVE